MKRKDYAKTFVHNAATNYICVVSEHSEYLSHERLTRLPTEHLDFPFNRDGLFKSIRAILDKHQEQPTSRIIELHNNNKRKIEDLLFLAQRYPSVVIHSGIGLSNKFGYGVRCYYFKLAFVFQNDMMSGGHTYWLEVGTDDPSLIHYDMLGTYSRANSERLKINLLNPLKERSDEVTFCHEL